MEDLAAGIGRDKFVPARGVLGGKRRQLIGPGNERD